MKCTGVPSGLLEHSEQIIPNIRCLTYWEVTSTTSLFRQLIAEGGLMKRKKII